MDDKQITELILDTSRELENVLNKNLLVEFGKRHNISPEQNRFSLKQEIVAKSSYFLNVKKKYALHVTNTEGVPVDELDVKGLITRRSDYPSLTKEKINELLKLLVFSEKIDRRDIDKFDEETEKYIRTLCAQGKKEVGRPVTYSKDDSEYKKPPIGIAGMKLWNLCEYAIFVPGTKGYLYKITDIDWTSEKLSESAKRNREKIMSQELKYVVVPPEAEKLPEYFIIDIEAMVKFAWSDRAEELLLPIGGRKCNRKNNIEQDIFTF